VILLVGDLALILQNPFGLSCRQFESCRLQASCRKGRRDDPLGFLSGHSEARFLTCPTRELCAAGRLSRMKLAVALAHKLARIAWGVLVGGRNFEVVASAVAISRSWRQPSFRELVSEASLRRLLRHSREEVGKPHDRSNRFSHQVCEKSKRWRNGLPGALEPRCSGLPNKACRQRDRVRSDIHGDSEQIAPRRDLIDYCKTANAKLVDFTWATHRYQNTGSAYPLCR
jgi:hypothetical protein